MNQSCTGLNQNEIDKRKKILVMPSIANKVIRWFRRRRGYRALSSNTTRRDKECPVVPPMSILPDDVITNIFSRLPVECVARSRQVCKRWLALFSSPHFARMHLKRSAATPVLLLQNCPFLSPFNDSSLVIVPGNNNTKTRNTKPCTYNLMKMIGTDPASLYASCDGLLVFRRGFVDYLICNPVTREQVTIKQPVTSLTRMCCGIIFHPQFEEDVLLFHEEKDPNLYEYSTYGVSNKLWRRSCSFAYKPCERSSSPIICNSRLHWLAFNDQSDASDCRNCIITCDMNIGDFRCMPHPGKECQDDTRWESHGYMKLLEMKGVLCFGDYDSGNKIIRIWTMEDYGSWSWLLNFNIYISTMDLKCRQWYDPSPELLKIEDGSLMFAWGWGKEELIVYHLTHKTIRSYDLAQYENQKVSCTVVSYAKSFISLGG